MRNAAARFQFEYVIDVLRGLYRFEQGEIAERQLSADLQSVQLQKMNTCFAHQFVREMIGDETLGRMVVLQVVASVDWQTLGQIVDLVRQTLLFDEAIFDGDFAQRVAPSGW